MLFGSVPRPPRKPRSCISTQSARQNTSPDHTAYRTSRGRPVRNTTPSAASTMTTTRLTANPLLAANEPKSPTSADRTCGCAVPDMAAPCWPAAQLARCGPPRSRGPARPAAPPCPGGTARSRPASAARPRDAQAPAGSAIMSRPPRRAAPPPGPRSARSARARRSRRMTRRTPTPPGPSPRWPARPAGIRAARRDQQPDADPGLDPHRRAAAVWGGTTRSFCPRWTRCWTHRRRARGRLDDLRGSPPAISGWACRIHPTPTAGQTRPAARAAPGASRTALRCPAAEWTPHPRRGPQQPQQRDDEQRDEALMQQRGPERGDQDGVGRAQA